ncbi:hypothetical protein UA08_04098 [Talaromyces atroroseus]|uniref:Gfd2/YDR514C-like C-terminal domain-containing protein n=1 Tax=Talaromyces atroroseus TaxID=1441469 RepID=A0A1Q5Q8A0_TALAT|nr:hypothetical protein UA08_04098 [Talaromyces atroroseus]OKL60357.1 hypothetical protein UA08_04098 [Talaromyces atroroseus]
MDKPTQRLNLLFSNNEFLLKKDTGLHLPVPEPKLNLPGNMTANSQTLVEESSANLSRGKNKEHGGEPDECLAFETGIAPPSSLVAQAFCPAAAIAKLPYKYMRRETSGAISSRFFEKGAFWARDWELYYIFPPPDLASRALLLLPASQVQQFLDQISNDCNVRLTIPMDPGLGLLLSFQEKGIPQPQYLGNSSNMDTKEQLLTTIPTPEYSIDCKNPTRCNIEVADGTAQAFREKMEAGLNAIKNKSKASREKKRAEKIERQRQWVHSLKRAQCYLGLHPVFPRLVSDRTRDIDETTNPAPLDDLSIAGPMISKLRLELPAPFSFVHDPIFICIDMEWNERRHNEVTEVGISTLDTLDIANVAPGAGGKNWIRWIRSRHIRIREYAHVVNRDFVSGCPGRFDFGQSEFVALRDAPRVVESCFRPPYSAQVPVKFVDQGPFGEPRVIVETTIREYKLRNRNIILVGHGLQGDMHYLGILGCNIFSDNISSHLFQQSPQYSRNNTRGQHQKPQFLDMLDTASMFQVLKRDINTRSLETVLNGVDIIGWNLHNAGNDARFTLEAMVRIIINARLALDNIPQDLAGDYADWATRPIRADINGEFVTSYETAWKSEVERRVAEANAEREMQVRDDCKIWELVTGWNSEHPLTADDIDGGCPKGIVPMRVKKQTAQ